MGAGVRSVVETARPGAGLENGLLKYRSLDGPVANRCLVAAHGVRSISDSEAAGKTLAYFAQKHTRSSKASAPRRSSFLGTHLQTCPKTAGNPCDDLCRDRRPRALVDDWGIYRRWRGRFPVRSHAAKRRIPLLFGAVQEIRPVCRCGKDLISVSNIAVHTESRTRRKKLQLTSVRHTVFVVYPIA